MGTQTLRSWGTEKVHTKARCCERCHSSNMCKGHVSECCPCRNLNPSPKEVLVATQVEESGRQALGLSTVSHFKGCLLPQKPLFTNPQKPLFLDCGFLLGFTFAESIYFVAPIYCQLSWGDGKIFYLSSYVWVAFFFFKGKGQQSFFLPDNLFPYS